MGNLGAYQTMTALAKRVGGPKVLAVVTAVGGYAALRPAEAAVKRAVGSLRKRNVPCPTRDLTFRATSSGEDGSGLQIREGSEYRVLECDDDAVLIDLVGSVDNPHMTSGEFLASISAYPRPPAGTSGSSSG